MYYICHQVYCRGYHLTSGTTLGCIRTLTSVCYICHQVVCISCHVNQEPHMVYCICHHVHQKLHLGVLHLLSSVLQRPSSNIRNNTRVLFRSLTWVYCICHQVVCISYHVNQEPHMVSSEAYSQSSVLQRQSCTSGA